MQLKKVAVIGAGPMGLAVAYQLIKDGYQPEIFEAGDKIGGMSATFDFGGLDIERYYHFHCTSDLDFLELLGELGLAEKMRWTETKMGYWYRGRLQSWGNPWALLTFRGLSLISKIRYGLHMYLSVKRNDWRDLDALEATSWIRRWVGKEAFDILWHRLFEYKFYDYQHNLSAAWIWSRIRRIGRSRYNIFKEKLGYLEGGSSTLLRGLEQFIAAHGGQIHLKRPISRVRVEQGKVKGVEIGNQFLPFDKVVSTVPLPYIPAMVPDLPTNALERYGKLKNIAVICVIAKLRKPVTPYFWVNVNDPEMDIPGIVEYSNLRPLSHHIAYVPFYMPGEHPKFAEPNQIFLDKVRRYFKKINPALRDEDFVDIYASRYRFAQPICPPCYLEALPPFKTAIQGLWIADTSYYYPEDRGISESIGFGRKMAKMVVA